MSYGHKRHHLYLRYKQDKATRDWIQESLVASFTNRWINFHLATGQIRCDSTCTKYFLIPIVVTSEEIKRNTAESTSCDTCGAPMTYQPSSNALVCEYCGSKKSIEKGSNLIQERDFLGFMQNYEKENFTMTKVVECNTCHAQSTVNEQVKSMRCPYCSTPFVERNIHEERYIQPEYIAPFVVDKSQVAGLLQGWIKGLWFAPNKIQRGLFAAEHLSGVYVPFWTYDMQTYTQYKGERGDAYYVTVGSGENKRRERRISWTNVRGTVTHFYDDILISGNKTLKSDLLQSLSSSWNPKAIQPIKADYLKGFITEKYQIDIKEAYDVAKRIVSEQERERVRRHIGGDQQRIHQVNTDLSQITFKHILLPLYVSSFSYKNKQYTYYVNGVTGKITGEQPYSAWKIGCATVLAIILIVLFVILISKN